MCTISDADSPHACDMCNKRLLPNEKDILLYGKKGIERFYTNYSSIYYTQIITQMPSAYTPVTILKLEQQVEREW